MTNQEQLREAVEVIKDHLNRNQFWNRDKNRNDMLEVLLDLAQSHLDGKWIKKGDDDLTAAYMAGFEKGKDKTREEMEKKMDGLLKILLEHEFGMTLGEIYDFTMNKSGLPRSDAWKCIVRSKETLATALRTYLKVGR
jgi:hypothetical protein